MEKYFLPKFCKVKFKGDNSKTQTTKRRQEETTTAHHHNHHQTNNMEEVAASEIPDGFFLADPSGGPKQPSSTASDQAAQRDAQRQAVLEQAMTPDALARLRRVKVG